MILRGIGLGFAALALNLLVAFLWVYFYSFAIAPGHDPAFYQAYAERVSPISAIVAGIPILFTAGYLAAARAPGRLLLAAALPAITYAAIDAAIVITFVPQALAAWPIFLLSWGTKLLAAWAGGIMRRRRSAAQ